MDKNQLDELNYLVGYINNCVKSGKYDEYFDQTINVISHISNTEKLLYIICNCPIYTSIVKNNAELLEPILNTLKTCTASELVESYKYYSFRQLSSKVASLTTRKALQDKSQDLDAFVNILCENPMKIGKSLFEKLIEKVSEQSQVKLILNKFELSGEFVGSSTFNNFANTAYVKNDFDLAYKLLDSNIKQVEYIKSLNADGILPNENNSISLQTLENADNYLFSVMRNCINIKNYKKVLSICDLFNSANIDPNPYYLSLIEILPKEDEKEDYADLLITLSKHTDLLSEVYNILEPKFCEYVKDPIVYLNMFKQPSANAEVLLNAYHELTDFDNLKEYFSATLEIANLTSACKHLQSQIFATCPYPKVIQEYIKTCSDSDLSYLATLQGHNKNLKKVLSKTNFTPTVQNPPQNTLF